MNNQQRHENDRIQICSFMIDQCLFGIDVRFVQEVLRHQDATRIPLVPKLITGLINLRGQVVMAIDVRRRLGFPDRPRQQTSVNIVVKTSDGIVSLVVDELREVLSPTSDVLEQPPQTMPEHEREFITGCYKLEDHLLLMLDTERLTNVSLKVSEFHTT